jgi:NTP pyrophosphatase (non-canonical NTP hydrolase)
MTQPYNGLSAAEAERLALLAEEAGEIVQAVGKILRHGYNNLNPYNRDSKTNREHLEQEIGDLTAIVQMMAQSNDLQVPFIKRARAEKSGKMVKYLHHQEDEDGWLTYLRSRIGK